MAESTKVTAGEIMNRIERQAYLCALSGRDLTPKNASVDHIQPLSRGGTHTIDNIWIVDHQVNIAKGTMTVDEFTEMCRQVVAYSDYQDALARGDI